MCGRRGGSSPAMVEVDGAPRARGGRGVLTSYASLIPPQAAGLTRSAVRPFPTKACAFAGDPSRNQLQA